MQNAGTSLPAETNLNFLNATIADNPSNKSTDITISAAVSPGTAAQLYQTNAVPSPTWITVSGDSTVAVGGAWTNVKINGASVPTAGGLTTGNVLQVTGGSALGYGAVNLAGGAGYVTGLLPAADIAPGTDTYILTTTGGVAGWAAPAAGGITALTGDVTASGSGSVAATVARINGATVPAAGSLTVGSVPYVSGVSALSYVTPTESPSVLPFPAIQIHKIAYWSGASAANGAITAGSHYWGFGSITINGTASSPESTSGSTATKLAATKGVTYTQASTSTGVCGIYDGTYINAGVAQVGPWRGNAANRGGFLFRARFSVTAIGNTSKLHAMIGLVDAVGSSSTDWVTNTAIARIGMAFTATTTAGSAFPSANWQMMEGAHTTPTAHDLGASFPLTVSDFIELILYCAPNDTSVTYTVNNLTTGATATGALNTTLPSTTTFLIPYVTSSIETTTSGANSFKITMLYLENFDA